MDPFKYDKTTKELFVQGQPYEPYPGGLGKWYYNRIKQILQQDKNIIAQIEVDTGKQQTYQEFYNEAIKLAQYMRTSGVQFGDVISMCSYNTIPAGVVLIAAQFIGAVLASTDPILSVKDTTYLLNMVKPKLIFVSDGSQDLIKNSIINLPDVKVISFAANDKDYERYQDIIGSMEVPSNFEPFHVDNLDATAAILFSSGTTGMPKGICLTHNYFILPLANFKTMDLKLVIFNYATLYWISSVYNLLMCVNLASTRLLCRKFDKKEHWNIVQKYKVNYMTLSNTYCMEALKYLPENNNISSLKIMTVAGGLIPIADLNEYTRKLPSTTVGYIYALTEGGVVTGFKTGDPTSSVGKPVPCNQTIKIVNPDTEENLPLNKVGEIRVKRKSQMSGYYGMDSSSAWDKDGFLKTGDLGYLDDNFNLYVVDRIKEMFKYRSWHIVPAKIEAVLEKHPDVLYAIVIGKPSHNEDENHALAVVCLHEGKLTTADEIEKFANAQLDEINLIRAGVVIVDKSDIAFTPTGKINRRILKEFVLNKN